MLWYSTNLLDLVSLNNSVKLFHQIKNLSEEFSLYFDVSIRLIRRAGRRGLILPKLKTFVTVEKLPSKPQCVPGPLLFSLQEIYNRTDGGWRDKAIMRSHREERCGET